MSTADTTVNTHLIEDYLHTTDIMVDMPEKGISAVVAPYINHQGESETLVVTQDESGGSSVYQVVREPKSDSGWNYYGLGAQPNYMAVLNDSHVWIYGTDNKIWIYQNGSWKKQQYQPDFSIIADRASLEPDRANAFANRMGASLDGKVWCLDRDDNLWVVDPASKYQKWEQSNIARELSHVQAPVGTTEKLYALNDAQKIYRFDAASPNQGTKISPPDKHVSMISMGSDGVLWALCYGLDDLQNAATLYQYNEASNSWGAHGTTALDMISVADSNNIFGITKKAGVQRGNQQNDLELLSYDATAQSWSTIDSQSVVGVYLGGKMSLENAFGLVAVPGSSKFWYFDTLIKTWSEGKTVGQGSWNPVIMPTGMQGPVLTENEGNFTGNVSELVVGVDKRLPGVSRCFFTAGGRVFYSTYLEGQAWSFPSIMLDFDGNLHTLGLTNQMDDGSLILYAGEEDSGKLFTAVQPDPHQAAAWTVRDGGASGLLKPAASVDAPLSIALTAKTANDWCLYVNYETILMVGFGTAAQPPNTMMKFVGKEVTHLTAREIIRLPVGDLATDHFVVVIDNDGAVQIAWGMQAIDGAVRGRATAIGGDGTTLPYATYCAGVLDTNNLFRLYATDKNDRLWVLRQTSATATDQLPFTLTHWHPLGDTCIYLANGPGLHATTEVFSLDSGHFLQSVRQNTATGIWESTPIHKPQTAEEDPLYVSQYVTELSLTQAGTSVPMPGQAVQLSAVESLAIWHKGVQYNLGPGQNVNLVTDRQGKISVSTLAFGLHCPALTFSSATFAPAVTVYPSNDIHKRLADMNVATLQSAQKYTKGFQSKPEPLVPSGAPNLKTASDLIQSTYTIKTQNNIGAANVTGANIPAHTSHPAYAAALQQSWQSKLVDVQMVKHPKLSAAAAESGWDKFWHSVAHFAQDVWHAIKKGVMKLAKVVVDVEKGVIQLTAELEGLGSSILTFAIKTIDDVVHAVQTAFKWIKVEVEDAINWLKSTFHWEDVMATKDVIKFFINYGFTAVGNGIDPDSPNSVQAVIQQKADELKQLIMGTNGNGLFDQARATIGKQTFNQYATANFPQNTTIGTGTSRLIPDKIHAQFQAHQVRCNYVKDKVAAYHNRGGKVSYTGIDSTNSLSVFLQLFEKDFDMTPGSPFYNQIQTLSTKIQAFHQQQESFLDLAMTVAIDLIEDLIVFIIDAIEALILGILNNAHEGVKTIQDALNFAFDIPVISWLYKQISGDDLSVLDLLCLFVSLPLTIIYKVIWGGPQFLPPFTNGPAMKGVTPVSDITSRLPSIGVTAEGTLGFQSTAQARAAVSIKAEAEGAEDNSWKALLGIVALLNAFVLSAADVLGALDIPDDEMPFEDMPKEVFDVVSIICQFIDMGVNVPYEAMGNAKRSIAEDWLIGMWAAGALGPLVDILFVVLPEERKAYKNDPEKDEKNEKWQEHKETAEAVVSCLAGAARLAAAIGTTVEVALGNGKVGASELVAGYLAPLPSITNVLKKEPNEVTVAIMVTTDILCDIGAGVCSLVGDLE